MSKFNWSAISIALAASPFNVLNIAVASALVLTLSGCDSSGGKFDIVRSGNQSFLLNKSSGEAKLIDGTTLVDVKSPETASGTPQKTKVWPPETIPSIGNVIVSIQTKFRDGQMLYVATAKPYDGALANGMTESLGQPSINFTLNDADSFAIGGEVELLVKSAMRIVDSKGKPTHLQWIGSQPMSLASYQAAAALSFGWRGFPATDQKQ